MRVSNKKVNLALAKLEQYQTTDSGFACPGTYGILIKGFKTQKEFIEYVESL